MAFLRCVLRAGAAEPDLHRCDFLRAGGADAADDAQLHGRRDDAGRLSPRRQPGAATSRTSDSRRSLDPFGLNAFQFVTRYWTPAEKNATLVGLQGDLLYNRADLGGRRPGDLGDGVRALPLSRTRRASGAGAGARARDGDGHGLRGIAAPPARLQVPAGRAIVLARRAAAAVSLARCARSFWSIVANRYFFAILGAGSAVSHLQRQPGRQDVRHTTWPVTYEVAGSARRHVRASSC